VKYRDGQWAVLLARYGFLSMLPALLVLVSGLRLLLAGHSSWRQQILDTAADADVPVLRQQLCGDAAS
jgi:uncharacterized BrkB/YihY/UPF0761 family membrane protein